MRTLRLLNALACPILAVAIMSPWGGRWLALPLLVSGVAAVLLVLRDRELRRLDEPTLLTLRR
jgi:hypothetical protein